MQLLVKRAADLTTQARHRPRKPANAAFTSAFCWLRLAHLPHTALHCTPMGADPNHYDHAAQLCCLPRCRWAAS